MISINSISAAVGKIVPRTTKGKILVGAATLLTTVGGIVAECSTGDNNHDQFVKVEAKYSSSSGNEYNEVFLLEDGCGIQNNKHKYLAKDGKIYEFNEEKQKWKKVKKMETTSSQLEILNMVADMNKENNNITVLSKKDIIDMKAVNPLKLRYRINTMASGYKDLMICHNDDDGHETQLVLSHDNVKE